MIYVFDRVENIAGNGESAGFQHFLLFLQCFLKLSFSASLKELNFRMIYSDDELFITWINEALADKLSVKEDIRRKYIYILFGLHIL